MAKLVDFGLHKVIDEQRGGMTKNMSMFALTYLCSHFLIKK